ncbi:MAG: peptide chain release factor 3, partial [Oscillospiraceae bacterium]
IRMKSLLYQHIRWIENEDIDVKSLNLTADTKCVEDFKNRKILLFTSPWNVNWAMDKNPKLRLSEIGR